MYSKMCRVQITGRESAARKISASAPCKCECKSRWQRMPPCSERVGRIGKSACTHVREIPCLFTSVSLQTQVREIPATEMLGCSLRGPEILIAEGPHAPKANKRQTKGGRRVEISLQQASLQPRSYEGGSGDFKASLASGSSLDPSRRETWAAPHNVDILPGRRHQKSSGLQAREKHDAENDRLKLPGQPCSTRNRIGGILQVVPRDPAAIGQCAGSCSWKSS